MGLLQRHFTALTVMAIAVAAAVVYSVVVPEKYEVTARVVVHRSPVEAPNLADEASRNRWVWVRDGYAIQDALLSHDFLLSLVEKSPLLKERYERFVSKHQAKIRELYRFGIADSDLRAQFLVDFKSALSVDYLGGDAFTYVIKVHDEYPALAREVATAILARLRELVVDETRASYRDSLLAIRREIRRTTLPDIKEYLGETYRGLLASSILFEASSARRVEVIQAPSMPLQSVWPKIDRLLILALVAGLGLGLLTELLLARVRTNGLQTA